MTVVLDQPLVPVLPGAVRGIEAMHTWTSPTGLSLVLNDHTVWPQYHVDRIEGRHGRGDVGDVQGGQGGQSTLKHDPATARMGEIVRRTLLRGKTETWTGRIRASVSDADPLTSLRGAQSAFLAAFSEPGEGTMRIEPKPGSGRAAMDFRAEVLDAQSPDDQSLPPWQGETGGWEREFTLALRLSDPRYVEDLDRTVQTTSIASSGGVSVPVSLPVAIPGLTTSAGTATAHNGGNAPVDPVLELRGYAQNPEIWNDTLGQGIRFDGLTINDRQLLTLDFGARTMRLGSYSIGPPFNYAPNPSFEGDTLGLAPSGWAASADSGSLNTFAVYNGWANRGVQSLRATKTGVASGQKIYLFTSPSVASSLVAAPGQVWSAQVVVNRLAAVTGGTVGLVAAAFRSDLSFIDTPGIGATSSLSATGVVTLTVTTSALPANTAYLRFYVQVNNGGSTATLDVAVDDLLIVTGSTLPSYFDGDMPGYAWEGVPYASRSGAFVEPASAQPVPKDLVDWSESGWWDVFVPGLDVGDNTIRYRAAQADANAIATVRWRNASYG